MSQIIFGLREGEKIAVVQQILLRVPEAFAPDIRFLHSVGADGGPHRAVDDDDALLEQLLEGMRMRHRWWLGRHVGSVKTCEERCRFRFVGDQEDHLQMRFLGLSACHIGGGNVEPGLSDHTSQVPWREAGMALPVASGDLVLLVPIEAKKNEPAGRTKHAGALAESLRGVLGVRQRVKEKDGVERRRAERQLVNVGDFAHGRARIFRAAPWRLRSFARLRRYR